MNECWQANWRQLLIKKTSRFQRDALAVEAKKGIEV